MNTSNNPNDSFQPKQPSPSQGVGMGASLRRLNSDFATRFISEKGTMLRNRDYFAFVEMDGFACWVIAESYDNELEVSSAKLAIGTVLGRFTKKPSISKRKLKSYVKEAHRQFKKQSGRFQLKASIMVVATNYKKMRYAHCGNCRLHIFRNNNIALKSVDQSLYQEMVRNGVLPDDEHYTEESRNLFHYLGKRGSLKINASKKMDLYDEDVLLLSTWGFWEKVSTIEMLDALEDSLEPDDYLDTLQDLLLSKQDVEEHVNNFTLATVFVKKTFQEKSNKKRNKIIITIVVAVVLALVIGFSIFFWNSNRNRTNLINSIAEQEQRGNIHLRDRNFGRALNEFDDALTSSEDLRGIRRSRVRANQEIQDNLAARHRLAQLLTDAESFFRDGNYQEARFAFERALDEATSSLVLFDTDILYFLDTNHINNRMAATNDHEFIQDLILTADSQMALMQFDLALDNYWQAMRLAEAIGNARLQRDIALMIERARSQAQVEENAQLAVQREQEAREQEQVAQARADRLLANEVVELEANRLLQVSISNRDIAGIERAIELFAAVQNVYIELGEISRVIAIDQRISEARESIRQQEEDEQADIAWGYITTGDNFMLTNNFVRALDSYRMARDMFAILRRTDDVNIASERISLATTRLTESDMAYAILNIMMIESEGDDLLLQGDFAGAIERYMQAQILFRGINEMDRALLLEYKIRGAREMESLSSFSADDNDNNSGDESDDEEDDSDDN